MTLCTLWWILCTQCILCTLFIHSLHTSMHLFYAHHAVFYYMHYALCTLLCILCYQRSRAKGQGSRVKGSVLIHGTPNPATTRNECPLHHGDMARTPYPPMTRTPYSPMTGTPYSRGPLPHPTWPQQMQTRHHVRSQLTRSPQVRSLREVPRGVPAGRCAT